MSAMGKFQDLSEQEAVELRAKSGASRMVFFIKSIVASGMLCSWGDEEDLLFIEDADGLTVLPVWSHPTFAILEHARRSLNECPVEVTLDRFIEVWLPQLERDGLGIAVFPVENRIAVSLTPAQFRSKIDAERRRIRRMSHA